MPKKLTDDELNKLYWMLFGIWALDSLGGIAEEEVLLKKTNEISESVAKKGWNLNKLINGMIAYGVDEDLVLGVLKSQGVEVFEFKKGTTIH